MHDPFKITQSTCISFSGGPTSADMLWRVLQTHGGLITYTLPEEGGGSLRASGWRLVSSRGGGAWSRPSRPRADTPEHLRGSKCLREAPGGTDKAKRRDAD